MKEAREGRREMFCKMYRRSANASIDVVSYRRDLIERQRQRMRRKGMRKEQKLNWGMKRERESMLRGTRRGWDVFTVEGRCKKKK